MVATSGSTAQPKGVLLTASALRASAAATLDRLGGPGQWLLALPVDHIAGVQVLIRSLLARIRPVVLDLYGGFDAEAFSRAVATLSPGLPCYVSLVPTQVRRLVEAGADLSRFDAILVGAAAFPVDLRHECADRGWNVVETYGMTEVCGGVVYDGRPLDGVDVDLDQGGRITIGGPTVFSGYRLRPDLTALALVDGRHVTADLGRWTEDGRLEVPGRLDDVIVTGGVNVPAAAVEQVIAEHPGVALCAVVGLPDPEWGQRVSVLLQPTSWDRAPTLEELREFCRNRLEPAALPKEVRTTGLLPMLPSGKPDKAAVRDLLQAAGS